MKSEIDGKRVRIVAVHQDDVYYNFPDIIGRESSHHFLGKPDKEGFRGGDFGSFCFHKVKVELVPEAPVAAGFTLLT